MSYYDHAVWMQLRLGLWSAGRDRPPGSGERLARRAEERARLAQSTRLASGGRRKGAGHRDKQCEPPIRRRWWPGPAAR